jgi:drug/metabolite transporter (DMT)-like permease
MRSLPLLAICGLLINALVWGTSWWPFRELQARGLHSLWATVFIYAVSCAVILLAQRGALRQLLQSPQLWWISLAAGITNATFNWGVTIGDVVRIVLLFYLMPIWAVLLARWLLKERLTAGAAIRIALALIGASLVINKGGVTWQNFLPVPQSLPDWLGVAGGMSFALNNVMLRKHANAPAGAKALAMFMGGMLLSAAIALPLTLTGAAPPPMTAQAVAWAGGAMLAAWFLIGNLALQYGASRLPANVTAVVMLAEVIFAAASAVVIGGEVLSLQVWMGGGLIMLSAVLAAFDDHTHA